MSQSTDILFSDIELDLGAAGLVDCRVCYDVEDVPPCFARPAPTPAINVQNVIVLRDGRGSQITAACPDITFLFDDMSEIEELVEKERKKERAAAEEERGERAAA